MRARWPSRSSASLVSRCFVPSSGELLEYLSGYEGALYGEGTTTRGADRLSVRFAWGVAPKHSGVCV